MIPNTGSDSLEQCGLDGRLDRPSGRAGWVLRYAEPACDDARAISAPACDGRRHWLPRSLARAVALAAVL